MKYRKYDIVKNDNFYIANSFNSNGYSSNGIYYLISNSLDNLKQQIDNEIKQLKQVAK
jgi:hypothetical protein